VRPAAAAIKNDPFPIQRPPRAGSFKRMLGGAGAYRASHPDRNDSRYPAPIAATASGKDQA